MVNIRADKFVSWVKGGKEDPESLARIEALKAEMREDNVVLKNPERTWRGASTCARRWSA